MQPRYHLVLEFWDRSSKLKIMNQEYSKFVKEFMKILLKQDIKQGDITSNSLIKSKEITAVIAAKEEGVIAGLEELSLINKDLKLKFFKKDGDIIKSGDTLVKIKGNARKILEKERVSLNLLQRMSGIATNVYKLNKKYENKLKLAATRKTPWSLLDKKAVSIGGGLTHRLSLNEGIIIKDNHLKLMNHDFEKAINSAKNKSRYIEVEVENELQAVNAAMAIKKAIKKNNKNLHAIMLDKIQPNDIKSIIKNLKNQNLYDYVLLEASGNISHENLHEYSDCGADIISMGCITNSAKALDISMEVK